MRQITVISGKGGTGKTSITASLAALAQDAVLADCDVDAANLELLLGPTVKESHDFVGSKKAFIDRIRCTRCERCLGVCRAEAIRDFKVDPFSCEGCSVCYHACPEGAVEMREGVTGRWFLSDTPYGTLVHARLEPGEGNSGKLVTVVRNKAAEVAKARGARHVLLDGPPGIGCPVIASLAGVSAALVVTEPTLSGIHDAKRVLKVCAQFKVPATVCVNRYDLSLGNTKKIQEWCDEQGIEVLARIPYDPVVTEAMVRGLPVVEYSQGEVSRVLQGLWDRLREVS